MSATLLAGGATSTATESSAPAPAFHNAAEQPRVESSLKRAATKPAALHASSGSGSSAAAQQRWSAADVAQASAAYDAAQQQPGVRAMQVFGIGPQQQSGHAQPRGYWQPDASLPGAENATPPSAAGPAESDFTALDGARLISSYSVEPARSSGAGSGSGTSAGSGTLGQELGNAGSDNAPAAYAAALAEARQAPWKPDVGFGLEYAPKQARPLGDWEVVLQAAAAGRARPPTVALHGSGTAPQGLGSVVAGPAPPPKPSKPLKPSAPGARRRLAASLPKPSTPVGGDAGELHAARLAMASAKGGATSGGALGAGDEAGQGQDEKPSRVWVTMRVHAKERGNQRRLGPEGLGIGFRGFRAPATGLRGAREVMAAPGSLERFGAAEALRAAVLPAAPSARRHYLRVRLDEILLLPPFVREHEALRAFELPARCCLFAAELDLHRGSGGLRRLLCTCRKDLEHGSEA